MEYKKNILKLNAMQVFYFSVKFGLVIIYVLKSYNKKSSSILLRKNMLNSILAFFCWNACTLWISVENLETTPSTFFSKFSSEIYLSRIINYWDIIFTLYLTWGAFSLVCVLVWVCFSFAFSLIYNYQTGRWWDLLSIGIWILFAFSLT